MMQHHNRVRKTMQVRDLPASLTETLNLNPEAEVEVTVEVAGQDRHKELLDIMDRLGAQATERGLTPEILDDILNGK